MAFLSLARGELVYHASMPVLRASLSNQTCGLKLATIFIHTSYDDLGNRTSMTDGLGSVTYTYNSLSQLTSEKRVFSDTLEHRPVGDYNLSYEYTMSGKLKSYTDPFGDEIEYSHDKLGRLDAVTGSSYGGITTYASNPGYRAWGGLKQLEYGNGVEMSMTYNDKLQVDHFELVKDTTEIMSKNYEYYGDGRLKYMEDELNPIFDRLQRYDHLGRIKEGKSGAEARGGTEHTFESHAELTEEFDALGNNVGAMGHLSAPPRSDGPMRSPVEPMVFDDMVTGDCEMDGLPVPCSMALRALGSGAINLSGSWMTHQFAQNYGITVFSSWSDDEGQNAGERIVPNDSDAPISVQTNGTWSYHISISWAPDTQIQQGLPQTISSTNESRGKCTLFLNVVDNGNFNDDQTRAFRDELESIYEQIGVNIEYTSISPHYTLSVLANAPASANPRALGGTPHGSIPRTLANRGSVYIDRFYNLVVNKNQLSRDIYYLDSVTLGR